MKEMKTEVEKYQHCGKVEAAQRLGDQVNLLEERFNSIQEKLSKFTSPQANFEIRLNRALHTLRAVERNSCILDIASAGPSNVQDQYKHCLKMYRTLSEVKAEIENVIKTGRKICEDKMTKNSKKLTSNIDALKHLYNALGEYVTHSKVSLEKFIRIGSELLSTTTAIEKWLTFGNTAGSVVSDERHNSARADEVLFLSNEQIAEMLDKCNELYSEYNESCESTYLQEIRTKIDKLSKKFIQLTDNDVGKSLFEIKSTLQNLDTVSIDALR